MPKIRGWFSFSRSRRESKKGRLGAGTQDRQFQVSGSKDDTSAELLFEVSLQQESGLSIGKEVSLSI